jgi:hypothetical protein
MSIGRTQFRQRIAALRQFDQRRDLPLKGLAHLDVSDHSLIDGMA